MGEKKLPAGPEELTTEWLSEALGSDVKSFECEQIGIGVGLLGRLFRVTMNIDGHGAATAVAKFPTLDEGARMHVIEPLNFYEKEVRYYQELGPTSTIPTAKAYVAEFDSETRDFVLLLEDLGSRRMEDQIVGCPVKDACRAIDALVEQHAAWWEADFPAWLPAYSDPPYPQVLEGMFKQAWPRAVEVFGDHLSPRMRDYGERYPDLMGWFMSELAHRPWTMCHGDFRLDNLFFATSSDQPPVMAVDWQICFRGRAAYDLGYFISQSLRTDVRREHETSLKDRYDDGLQAKGIDYPRAELDKDYARTVAYCFIYAVVPAGQIQETNERMRELILGILDRSVAAIEDNDALSLLP